MRTEKEGRASTTGFYPWLGDRVGDRLVLVWGVTGHGTAGLNPTTVDQPGVETAIAVAAVGTPGGTRMLADHGRLCARACVEVGLPEDGCDAGTAQAWTWAAGSCSPQGERRVAGPAGEGNNGCAVQATLGLVSVRWDSVGPPFDGHAAARPARGPADGTARNGRGSFWRLRRCGRRSTPWTGNRVGVPRRRSGTGNGSCDRSAPPTAARSPGCA